MLCSSLKVNWYLEDHVTIFRVDEWAKQEMSMKLIQQAKACGTSQKIVLINFSDVGR
jgi:hypothetical protein